MLRQTEDRGSTIRQGVAANALEIAGAVMEGMGQDVNLGIFPTDQLTVEPDFFSF
jgi:hypothetical protein